MTMKRVLLIALVLLLTIVLTGCGDSGYSSGALTFRGTAVPQAAAPALQGIPEIPCIAPVTPADVWSVAAMLVRM